MKRIDSYSFYYIGGSFPEAAQVWRGVGLLKNVVTILIINFHKMYYLIPLNNIRINRPTTITPIAIPTCLPISPELKPSLASSLEIRIIAKKNSKA